MTQVIQVTRCTKAVNVFLHYDTNQLTGGSSCRPPTHRPESESERYLTRRVVYELYQTPLYPPESYHHQLFVVIMKFTLPSLLLAVAAVFVPAACTPIPPVECAEASRFGILKIGPSTVAPGDVCRSHCLDLLNRSLLIIH